MADADAQPASQAPSGEPAFEVPTMIDIEASGFGTASYPIEVGFVLPDGEAYCTLIHPAAEWTHWDAQAGRIHRIARTTLLKHGRAVAEVARQLNERLHGQTVYCDGWAHDYVWLGVLFEAAGRSPSFRLENLRALLSEREAAFWAIVKAQVTTEMRLQRHRASADARILRHTLLRLRQPLPRPGPATPDAAR